MLDPFKVVLLVGFLFFWRLPCPRDIIWWWFRLRVCCVVLLVGTGCSPSSLPSFFTSFPPLFDSGLAIGLPVPDVWLGWIRFLGAWICWYLASPCPCERVEPLDRWIPDGTFDGSCLTCSLPEMVMATVTALPKVANGTM